MGRLDGRRVLITGASSGVGAAAAEAFAREGADVALVARSRDGLEAVAARVRGLGRDAHVVAADIGDHAGARDAVERGVAALGGLDVLVSNAAAMVFGRFTEVSEADFDRTLAVTFMGAVDVMRAALPHLEASAGTIVVTGSIMAKVPLPAFCSYAASKHALRGFVNSLRIELLQSGSPVTISMLHPGAVDTPLWGHVTSATGAQPRNPPDLYAPQEMARGLVALALKPRSEVTVGLEAKAIEVLFALARPVADRVLVLVERYYSSGREPAPVPGALHEAAGDGRAAGGLHGRPSLWRLLRLRS